MSDRANIKLPREKYEEHNDRRKELGLTWGEYLDGEAPEMPTTEVAEEIVDALAAGDVAVDADAIADAVAERTGGPNYDDMKAACRAALREELPEGAV